MLHPTPSCLPSVLELTRWYGPCWRGYAPQAVPTPTALLNAGAVATGECLPDYGDDADKLPPERDTRTWYVESPRRTTLLLLVPDLRGFYVEDEQGDRWRPACLGELRDLLTEMDTTCAPGNPQVADFQILF